MQTPYAIIDCETGEHDLEEYLAYAYVQQQTSVDIAELLGQTQTVDCHGLIMKLEKRIPYQKAIEQKRKDLIFEQFEHITRDNLRTLQYGDIILCTKSPNTLISSHSMINIGNNTYLSTFGKKSPIVTHSLESAITGLQLKHFYKFVPSTATNTSKDSLLKALRKDH